MTANNLPDGINDLLTLGGQIHEGLRTHGPWLQLDPHKRFPGALADLRKTEATLAEARGGKAAAGTRVALADEALTSWLGKARLVVMLACGGKWSAKWIAAGFTHRGTNVPKRLGPRIELARRVTDFLAVNARFEVVFAGVTAEEGRAVHAESTAAGRELRAATREATACKRRRDAAEKRLRREMRCMRLLLAVAIGGGDPRWREFGFNVPKPSARDRWRRERREASGEAALPAVAFTEPRPVETRAVQAA